MKSVVNIVFIGRHRRVLSVFFHSLILLSAGLIITSTLNASVSPHPRVEQMVKEKQITMPYYLAHQSELHTRGINYRSDFLKLLNIIMVFQSRVQDSKRLRSVSTSQINAR